MTTATAELTGDYTIDTAHSRVGFIARHAMVAKVRGALNEWEGTAHIGGENPANSSARVTIQAKSIDTHNSQRDDHLRGNDFLSMDNHSEITLQTRSPPSRSPDRPSSAGSDRRPRSLPLAR